MSGVSSVLGERLGLKDLQRFTVWMDVVLALVHGRSGVITQPKGKN